MSPVDGAPAQDATTWYEGSHGLASGMHAEVCRRAATQEVSDIRRALRRSVRSALERLTEADGAAIVGAPKSRDLGR